MTRASMLILVLMLLSVLAPLSSIVANSQSFRLKSYSYKSSANTNTIYPGSKNVELVVETKYVGLNTIQDVTGCLVMPEGFTVARGHTSCSPAYDANNTVYETVVNGDVVIFKYYINVLDNTTPGIYNFKIRITYNTVENGSIASSTEYLSGINITVSPYPNIKLDVVDYYWSPDAYPGSAGVSLNIVLENKGNASIINGHLKISLPQKLVERPLTVRQDIGTLNKNDRVTITLNNIDILPNATPNALYPVHIDAILTARTDDGVTYDTNTSTSFSVMVSSAPKVLVEFIDYGLTSLMPSNNTRLTKLYFTLQSKDTKTINSITAIISLESPNTTFANGSTTSITIIQGPINYGDYFTIRSNDIVLNTSSTIKVKLTLIIFGSDNGAEFWSIQEYEFNLTVKARKPDIRVIGAYWNNNRAYPGAASKTLNIVLLNNDVVDVTSSTIRLVLPKGFSPRELVATNTRLPNGVETTIAFNGINIDKDLKPGLYEAKIIITGVITDTDNSFREFNETLPVLINVSSLEKPVIEVVDSGWSNGRAYVTSYNVRAYTEFLVSKPVTIQSVVATVYLPPQLSSLNNKRELNVTLTGNYGYGQTFRIETPALNITTSSPGLIVLPLTLNILVSDQGTTTWIKENYTIILRVVEPKLNLTLVDASWNTPRISNETFSASMRLLLQSLHADQISNTVIIVYSETKQVMFSNGRNYSVQVLSGPINYGDILSATINGIDLERTSSTITFKVEVYSTIRLGESYYRVHKSFNVTLNTSSEEDFLALSRVETIYQGQYAPLLPTSNNMVIAVTLTNTRPEALSSVNVNVNLPRGFTLRGVDGTCLNGVGGGSSCTINIHVDLGNIELGLYPINLSLEYIVRSNTATSIHRQKISFNVPVKDINEYLPRIKPVEWYWGTQTPITVFGGDRNAPLTVIVYNPDRYSASGVLVKIIPLNSSVKTLSNTSYCGTIPSAGTCTSVFHIDLGNASNGVVYFNVIVEYLFTVYGAHFDYKLQYPVSLRIEEYAGGKGLEIVGYGWSNNWPVYPYTENATFQVTLSNRWPYQVSGITLQLVLPDGFKEVYGKNLTYIAGPIQSLASFTASFTINVGDVEPGIYKAKLLVDYVVDAGGPRLRAHEEHTVDIIVNNLKNALTLLDPTWVSGSPELGSYGVTLRIRIRDNSIPNINGPILEVQLPPGIYCSINNDTRVKLAPSTIEVGITPLLGQGRATATSQPNVQEILSVLTGLQQTSGQVVSQSFSKGNILSFTIPLNILVKRTGVYYANITLNFVDHWGNVRRVNFTLPLRILGSAKIIEVNTPSYIRVINGTSNLTIELVNRGSAPVYNVYVYFIPKSPLALPADATKYIDKLLPGEPVNVSFELRYNPMSVSYGAGGTAVQYSSLPIMLAILYRDATGHQYMLNTSTTVLLEPFIDVRFAKDVKAEQRGGILVVSGTLINYGLSSARSVEVRVIAGNHVASSFIGDIDPASESAFRVELQLEKSVGSVRVEALYRDEYNVQHITAENLSVTTIELNVTTTTTATTGIMTSTHIAVIGVVAAFLAIVAFMIYRYFKKHTHEIEETIP